MENMKENYIGPQIKRVNTEIEKRINEQNRVFQLTQSQGLVVIYLSQKENYTATQSELMELLHVAHTTTLKMLRSMAGKGIIKISPNPKDRRSNLITLTWGNEDIYRKLESNAENNEFTLLKGFTDDEREQFRSFLTRALENLISNPPDVDEQ
ncbi:MAG: MarR family transcriptional regulator [Eubacteriales bacterium]